MSYKKISSQLLGLKQILEYLRISPQDFAGSVGISSQHLGYLLAGTRSCSLVVLDSMTTALCCTPNDLLGLPSVVRLAEIRVAYLQRLLNTERDRLNQLRHEEEVASAEAALGEEAA